MTYLAHLGPQASSSGLLSDFSALPSTNPAAQTMHGASASTAAAAAQSSLGQDLCSLFQSCSLSDDDEPLPFDRKGLATSSRLHPASSQ
ncbi:hypothetical protein Nmel_000695 [Mimus melanotis]